MPVLDCSRKSEEAQDPIARGAESDRHDTQKEIKKQSNTLTLRGCGIDPRQPRILDWCVRDCQRNTGREMRLAKIVSRIVVGFLLWYFVGFLLWYFVARQFGWYFGRGKSSPNNRDVANWGSVCPVLKLRRRDNDERFAFSGDFGTSRTVRESAKSDGYTDERPTASPRR